MLLIVQYWILQRTHLCSFTYTVRHLPAPVPCKIGVRSVKDIMVCYFSHFTGLFFFGWFELCVINCLWYALNCLALPLFASPKWLPHPDCGTLHFLVIGCPLPFLRLYSFLETVNPDTLAHFLDMTYMVFWSNGSQWKEPYLPVYFILTCMLFFIYNLDHLHVIFVLGFINCLCG